MTKRNIAALVIILAIGVSLAIASGAFFVVDITKYAIIFEFGVVKKEIKEPGIYFKIPMIQNVEFLEKRVIEWDEQPTEILTVDKENISINSWARWKIADPLKFYLSLRSLPLANNALKEAIESSVKATISSYPLVEVLRSSNRDLVYTTRELKDIQRTQIKEIGQGRSELMRKVREEVIKKVREKYGIEIVDIKIRFINYVEDVIPKIYERMRSERYRIASKYESEGKEKEAEIEGSIKEELQTLKSEGYMEAEKIKGDAESQAIKIYADAYNKAPEFYDFIKTLETYERTFGAKTTIILSSDSDLFKLLKQYKNK